MILLDERSQPSMRATLAGLMKASDKVDIAVSHLRLAGLDFSVQEIARLKSLRLVIGRLDADALLGCPASRLQQLHTVARFGHVEVRAVPRFRWAPDFSVFHDHAALIGAHYTEAPYAEDGIAFTCLIEDAAVIQRCARRFEAMWQLGYDVLPVVLETLDSLQQE